MKFGVRESNVKMWRPTSVDASCGRKAQRRYAPVLIGLLFVLVATFLIVRTYGVFDQTYDEPAHIACGMEWLSHGTYNFEALHPPLARIASAILPFLFGVRDPGIANMWDNGNATLNWGGHYERNLTLARLGRAVVYPIALSLLGLLLAIVCRHFVGTGKITSQLLVDSIGFILAFSLSALIPGVRAEIASLKDSLGALGFSRRETVSPVAQ